MTQRDLSDELVEAIEAGIDADDYCAARGAGATHAKVLAAVREEEWPLPDYVRALLAGATHAECQRYCAADRRRLRAYVALLETGVSHLEVMEFLASEILEDDYLRAREAGATHAEILDAEWRIGSHQLYDYASRLEDGASHADALKACLRPTLQRPL